MWIWQKKPVCRYKVLQWESTFSNPFSTKPLTPATQFPALNATYAITSFQLSTALTWWGWGQRECTDRDTYEMPAEKNHHQLKTRLFCDCQGMELDTDCCDRLLSCGKMMVDMFAQILSTYASSHAFFQTPVHLAVVSVAFYRSTSAHS